MANGMSKIDIDPGVTDRELLQQTIQQVGQYSLYKKKYLLESGTPKLYLKSVAYTIELAGKYTDKYHTIHRAFKCQELMRV